jgi:hypothetical protein
LLVGFFVGGVPVGGFWYTTLNSAAEEILAENSSVARYVRAALRSALVAYPDEIAALSVEMRYAYNVAAVE